MRDPFFREAVRGGGRGPPGAVLGGPPSLSSRPSRQGAGPLAIPRSPAAGRGPLAVTEPPAAGPEPLTSPPARWVGQSAL
ncbi:hypothetical protein QF026_000805 [Streptomyces aurantiacus]|uniref:hypothetical protein n=1 Tax=Streptomyces aurantiacus TaxID=47760 RepID=UPI0027907A09|nr:hypothetical protein [Streptomyces aurantiacus]MDQ0772339.1 hypothetical protein [Streptomyces aurantiacus]